jgi:hypothetical protein
MSSFARSSIVVLSALAALATGSADRVAARQAPAATERPAGPTVDFIAVQADGTPAVDLQPAEVEIRINDRVRAVRALRRVTTGPTATDTTAGRLPPAYGTNDSVLAGRRFAIVVDQESLTAGHNQLVKNAVQGLLGALTAADQVMVAALPFGGVTLPFTSDPARVLVAIQSVTGQASRAETGSELACRTRRFLDSFDGFLRERPGVQSPLTVIVFTAGLAGARRDAPMAMAPGMCELLVDTFRQLTASASAARANMYIMQPADIGMSGSIVRESIAGTDYLGSDNPVEGIENLAGVTHAARLPLDATGTASLLRVARETSSYYEAELEPARGEVVGRSRKLDVRVKRKGITVRARPEIILVESARRPSGTRLAVTDLLASPEPFTDLRLRIGGFTVRDADGRLRVGVLVEPVDPKISLSSVGAILVAGDGRIVGRWFATDAAEQPVLGAIAASPGTYRLRVAAIDGDGRSGVAEDTVEAGLTIVGPLSLGSLMFGVSRSEGMTMQLEFGAEPTAIASFDIYGGTVGLSLSATLEVAREPDGPALVAVPLALSRADEGRVVATGAVPIGALPPGDYFVRGIIRLADGTTGSVARTLRKVAR